jgi:hypothetical protein
MSWYRFEGIDAMAADDGIATTPGHPMQARERGPLDGELTTPRHVA